MVPEQLGVELRDRRIALGLRQQDLAEQIGMSRGYVSMVEGGVSWTPPPEVLRNWSVALGWKPDELAIRILDSRDGMTKSDIISFIREQTKVAVHDELAAALTREDGALAQFVRRSIGNLMTGALVDALVEARDADRRIAERVVRGYGNFSADAVIEGEGEVTLVEAKTHSRPRRRARQVEH